MSSKPNLARLLLDTSSVVHQLHGHTLQQAAVLDAVAGGEVLVPVFVRMEYLRGVILNLIEMPSAASPLSQPTEPSLPWVSC
jgi:predicted nucleic acid-binding protein